MTPLTPEELTEARALLDPALPESERKRPTLELLRRMLATIDAQAARNKTLERKCAGLEQAATTALAEMNAAIDRAEKAEATLEDAKLEQEELAWANKIAVWAYARAEKAEAAHEAEATELTLENNGLKAHVAELQAIVDDKPRLASGEPAVEGMRVFAVCNTNEGVAEMRLSLCAAFDSSGLEDCYSTREAALAAQQPQPPRDLGDPDDWVWVDSPGNGNNIPDTTTPT